MVSKIGLVGVLILILGLILGLAGAVTPVASTSQQSYGLLDTSIRVDPNGYYSQNLVMTKGEAVQVRLSIDNQTMFTFDIMNQSQYYVYYGCAPLCAQPLLGGNGTYYQQAGEATPTFLNVTVSPSSAYQGQFTAPSDGTYYFVFDNSIGPTWANYVNQSAPGFTTGHFSLAATQSITNYAVNWTLVGVGVALLLVGGIVATVTWESKPKSKTT
jgi:hypothetical protein